MANYFGRVARSSDVNQRSSRALCMFLKTTIRHIIDALLDLSPHYIIMILTGISQLFKFMLIEVHSSNHYFCQMNVNM